MSGNFLADRRILIVEDEYLVAIGLSDMLQHLSAIVVGPASDKESAFQHMDPPPDYAILDVKLSDGTSIPVADELLRLGVRFIFATGSGEIIPERMQSVPICKKPYTANAIIAALSITQSSF